MEKQEVIKALQNNNDARAQFNELLPLFTKHPHHPAGAARFLNASGYTAANLETLKYDIKKTYGISDTEVSSFVEEKSKSKSKSKPNDETDEAENAARNTLTEELSVDFEALDYATELKPLATEIAQILGHEIPNYKKDTLIAYLNDQKANSLDVSAEEVSSAYAEAQEEVKEGLKLRQEFPFLSEDNVPDKLKILVADKFSALEKYEAAHEQIIKMKAAGETEGLFELGKKAVENWELNQEIYDELNYYQEHKEILGNHPIFADDMLQKNVDAFSTKEAMKRQGNLRTYISRDTKKVEAIKDAEKKAKAEAKVKEWQDELDLIDVRLSAADKK